MVDTEKASHGGGTCGGQECFKFLALQQIVPSDACMQYNGLHTRKDLVALS